MERNAIDTRTVLLFLECAAVFLFLLLPPLFSMAPFTIPPKPEGWYALIVFCCKTICAAAYEELLYRLYTPYRLHNIYEEYIAPRMSVGNHLAADTLQQKQFCCRTIVVFFVTEVPAWLLFTLAHRYLGIAPLLFAAGAGAVFRAAYCRLKRWCTPAVSITIVAGVHGLWNIGVYWYLWGFSFTSFAWRS